MTAIWSYTIFYNSWLLSDHYFVWSYRNTVLLMYTIITVSYSKWPPWSPARDARKLYYAEPCSMSWMSEWTPKISRTSERFNFSSYIPQNAHYELIHNIDVQWASTSIQKSTWCISSVLTEGLTWKSVVEVHFADLVFGTSTDMHILDVCRCPFTWI